MKFVDEEMVAAIASSVANASQGYLVEVTKVLNSGAGSHVVDAFMDTAMGRGHRIVFGHDISYLPEIFDKFGFDGARQYFVHLSKDVMSTDGIPLPFAHEIQQWLGLSTGQTINWLCLNIADILAGSLSVWHTINVFDTLQEGDLSKGMVLRLLLIASLKIAFSLIHHNPISLACGIIDLALLAYYAHHVISDMVSDFLFPESFLEEIAIAFTKATALGFVLMFVFEALRKLKKLLRKEITFDAYLAMITLRSIIFALIYGVLDATALLLSIITGISPVYVKPAIIVTYALTAYSCRKKISVWLGALDKYSERTANTLCMRAKGQWQHAASKSSQWAKRGGKVFASLKQQKGWKYSKKLWMGSKPSWL